MCGDSNRIAPLRNSKCLKQGLRRMVLSFRSWSANFLTTMLCWSRGGVIKFLYSLTKTTCLLCVCDTCVAVIYFYDKCCIYVTFVWHDCTYMWHIQYMLDMLLCKDCMWPVLSFGKVSQPAGCNFTFSSYSKYFQFSIYCKVHMHMI